MRPNPHLPPLDIVLLAAGLSSRMGARNKMLLPYLGQPLVRHVASQLLEAGIGRVHVVTGHEAQQTEAALHGLDVEFVYNPIYETGQMSSVRAGFWALPDSTAGVMIALGDMPRLEPQDYRRIAEAFFHDGGRQIAVPFFEGQRGNPIIIPPRFVPEVADGAFNAGCKKLVRERPDDVLPVRLASDACLGDIDTPDDYARIGAPPPPEPKGLELGTQG